MTQENYAHRLKALENSFTLLLMEAFSRMTELTQSRLFVLVETGEGRTFTGSSSLCKQYSGRGLIRGSNEVQLGPEDAQGAGEEGGILSYKDTTPQFEDAEDHLCEDLPEDLPVYLEDDSPDEDRGVLQREYPSGYLPMQHQGDLSEEGKVEEISRNGLMSNGEDRNGDDDPEKACWLPGSGSSSVWRYFEKHVIDSSIGRCKLCRSKLKRTGSSTTNLRDHLDKMHGIQAEKLQTGIKIPTNKSIKRSGPSLMARSKKPRISGLSLTPGQLPKKGRSGVWRFFHISDGDASMAICRLCSRSYSRGSKLGSKQSTSNLRSHLQSFHRSEFEEISEAQRSKVQDVSQEMEPVCFTVKQEPKEVEDLDLFENDAVSSPEMPSLHEEGLSLIDMRDISKNNSEMNLLFFNKWEEILKTDPKLCFAASSNEQKMLSNFMQSLGNYISKQVSPKLGHTNPCIPPFFDRCWDDFVSNYLKDFLSNLPSGFGMVKFGEKKLSPSAYCKNICHLNFRMSFRNMCIRSTFQI